MHNLISKLDNYILENDLLKQDKHYLLAVSGGLDSMVLCWYLELKKVKFTVAHCNFGLRAEASNLDTEFVESYCNAHHIQCLTKHFETQTFADTHGISIQMAARDLRYAWFDELCEINGFEGIITAHHQTDQVETVLLNLIRGTGLKGLTGMKPISGRIIRPLLILSRNEIEQIATAEQVNFREDESNSSDKYHRNRIRLNVLPEFEKINPAFTEHVAKTIGYLNDAQQLVDQIISEFKTTYVNETEGKVFISKSGITNSKTPGFILFQLLETYNFNSETSEMVLEGMNKLSGKIYFSPTHQLLVDREFLIITRVNEEPSFYHEIATHNDAFETPNYSFELSIKEVTTFEKHPEYGNFDFEKLEWPLVLRNWQQGDKIQPMGMTGHKKVSDILIDQKVNRFDKQNTLVLLSGNKIIWVVGRVISEEFKITNATKKVLFIKSQNRYSNPPQHQ